MKTECKYMYYRFIEEEDDKTRVVHYIEEEEMIEIIKILFSDNSTPHHRITYLERYHSEPEIDFFMCEGNSERMENFILNCLDVADYEDPVVVETDQEMPPCFIWDENILDWVNDEDSIQN